MKPLPLFPDDLIDRTVRETYRTKDELDYAKEKRRASRGKRGPMPKAPLEGPCCLRCRNWDAPWGEASYGTCRHLGVAEERRPARGIERGDVIAAENASIPTSRLRTGEAFSCSAYRNVEGVAA